MSAPADVSVAALTADCWRHCNVSANVLASLGTLEMRANQTVAVAGGGLQLRAQASSVLLKAGTTIELKGSSSVLAAADAHFAAPMLLLEGGGTFALHADTDNSAAGLLTLPHTAVTDAGSVVQLTSADIALLGALDVAASSSLHLTVSNYAGATMTVGSGSSVGSDWWLSATELALISAPSSATVNVSLPSCLAIFAASAGAC